MASQKNINNAKLKLSHLLASKSKEELTLSTTNVIRELFDKIEPLIKTKAAKTEEIYQTIKSEINDISYSSFRTILSRIRKEKGIQLRNRTKNNKIKSAIKPIIKSSYNQNEIKQPTEADSWKLLNVTLSPLQRTDIDRTDYTEEDWWNEWELIMKIYLLNKSLKWKYQVLGGNITDIEHFTNSLKDIRILSDRVSDLYRKVSNEYKIRSRKR